MAGWLDGLSKISVSTISVVESMITNSNRDSMGSNFGGNLSRGLNNTLHNRDMGNSVGSSKGKTSIAKMAGIAKSSKASIWKSSNQLRISLGLTLANDMMSSGQTISKMSKTITISKWGMSDHGGNSTDWRVMDERGGGGDDSGGSSKDSGVSISRPLAKIVTTIAIAKTVITKSNWDSMSSNLGSNLSGGLNNTLHNGDMGHSVSSSKGKTSIAKMAGIAKSTI